MMNSKYVVEDEVVEKTTFIEEPGTVRERRA